MNIRVDLNAPITDGTEVVFRSPVDCSQITGLIVYYTENGNTASKEFAFADAHGYNVGDIDHLFAENVVVKVILDVTTGMAFVQNADTNAYLEGRFNDLEEEINALGSFKLLETITLEEETKMVYVKFDKTYKAVRARITFPSQTTSNGYVYSKIVPAGVVANWDMYGNMCGTALPAGTMYADHIRIASEDSQLAMFSSSTARGNENAQPLKMCFPALSHYVYNEKDGFSGFMIDTYVISFPAGTVIHIMGG